MFRSALALPALQAPGRAARRRARPRQRLRPEGRVPDRLRAPGARGARRAAAGVRAAQEAARGRRPVRRARKRPLPALPRKIGVVTSLDGAAVRDIIRVLRRRYAERAHRDSPDARAGRRRGARNRARARARSARVPRRRRRDRRPRRRIDRRPVGVQRRGPGAGDRRLPGADISAVGHETDVTIADFVADLRAPTPSAAAEMVVARKDDFCAHIDRLAQRARRGDARAAAPAGGAAARARGAARLRRRPRPARDARPARRGAAARAAARDARAARRARARYQTLRADARDVRPAPPPRRDPHAAGRGRRPARRGRRTTRAIAPTRGFGSAAARLEGLSPLAVLGRGYAVCWNADRTRDHSRCLAVPPGDRCA